MSRTDKTAPWRVKILYYPSWVEEYHDHSHGLPCELPERPTAENIDQYDQFVLVDGGWVKFNTLSHQERRFKPFRNTCHWTASDLFYRSGMARCGCAMCKGEVYELRLRKRDRIKAKRYVRGDWVKEY